MSQNALRKIVKQLIDESAVKYIKNVSSVSSKGFRETLNRKLHILLINESILSTVSEEAIAILRSSLSDINSSIIKAGKGLGENGNASAIQLILAQYHNYRNKKPDSFRVRSFSMNNEKTYRLIFKNFNDVRDFLNTIGFYSRPKALQYILTTRKDILNRVSEVLGLPAEDIINLPIAGTDTTIMSIIASLQKSKDKESKELYKELNSLVDPISYDVGHNTPVQYEALEVLANNKEMMDAIMSGFMSGIYKTEADYLADIKRQNPKNSALRSKHIISTSLTAAAVSDDNVAKLMAELARELDKNVHSLDLVTHKRVHNKNNSVEGEFVITFPERTSGNQGKLENMLTDNFIKKIAQYLVKNKVISQQLAFSEASPSIPDIIGGNIATILKGEKIKTGVVVDTTVTNPLNITLPKIKEHVKKKVSTIGTKPKSANNAKTLRNIQGQFTSLTKLETLIRAGLQQALLKNMQRPNLRNQTGRFRESVELQKVSQARDGALTAFLSYMRYPYATFEKGGRQGGKGYYPSRLIDQSVRDIASKLVAQRMKVVVQ